MSWMISGLMGPTVQSGVGKPGIQSPEYLVCKELTCDLHIISAKE